MTKGKPKSEKQGSSIRKPVPFAIPGSLSLLSQGVKQCRVKRGFEVFEMHRLDKTRLVGDAHDASRVSTRHLNSNDSGKDSRGRSLVPLSLEEKQVRCVSLSLSLFPILLRGQCGAVNMTIMPPMQTEEVKEKRKKKEKKKPPQNPIRPDQTRLTRVPLSLRIPRPTCPAHEGA